MELDRAAPPGDANNAASRPPLTSSKGRLDLATNPFDSADTKRSFVRQLFPFAKSIDGADTRLRASTFDG